MYIDFYKCVKYETYATVELDLFSYSNLYGDIITLFCYIVGQNSDFHMLIFKYILKPALDF